MQVNGVINMQFRVILGGGWHGVYWVGENQGKYRLLNNNQGYLILQI